MSWRQVTASGALLCPRNLVETVRLLLANSHLLKHGLHISLPRNDNDDAAEEEKVEELVTTRRGRKVFVHVNAKAAVLLNNYHNDAVNNQEVGPSEQHLPLSLPDEIKSFLTQKRICWYSECRIIQSMPEAKATSSASSKKTFHFIELFAGIGGFRVGLEKLGGHCVFASEISSFARKTYATNMTEEDDTTTIIGGDITDYHVSCIPEHDILTAGFPCQSFSLLGDRQALDCDNGNLFFEIVRVLHHRRPRAFLLENVSNLLRIDEGRAWESIKSELNQAGYKVTFRVINCRSILPQQRSRLFIVGFREQEVFDRFAWPSFPIFERKIHSILQPEDPEHSYLTPKQWTKIQRVDSPEMRLARLDGGARTMTANYRKGFNRYSEFVAVPDRETPRFFSARECARLQGFPDSFTLDSPRIHILLGNAVCPPVIAIIGEALVEALCLPSPSTSYPGIRLLLESAGSDANQIALYLEHPDRFYTYSGCGEVISAPELARLNELLLTQKKFIQRIVLQVISHACATKASPNGLVFSQHPIEQIDVLLEQLLKIGCSNSSCTEFRRLALLSLTRLVTEAPFAERMLPFSESIAKAIECFREQHENAAVVELQKISTFLREKDTANNGIATAS